ncbi:MULTISPECIES: hypothetical protein [unclassified Streptomyces]|uniref:hypothetical protein n=1 Tax=unclassified Streptomyces TaxID=2593676 RepID=UPI000CD5639E|nr:MULTISPECIES: hypothetical protein [unclassified Streptomyces]
MSRATRPEWTVYSHSTDPQLHPLGPPPVPRDPDGRPVGALSWITGPSTDHGVLRTLAVHTAGGDSPASLTTWRHTGPGEPDLGPTACLRRDLGFHLGDSARQTPVSEEPYTFAGQPVAAVTAHAEAMVWHAFALEGATVTLAHHATEAPDWHGVPSH